MATNTLTDREWEVRLLFLDEVKDFLADIETEILGLSDRGLQRSTINKILRAAHSMKGGAAMMGFHALSELAHRLEDFFKILQANNQTAIAPDMESLFLAAIDGMGKVAKIHKQRKIPPENWLQEHINSPFQQLHKILGDLSAQDEASLLSEEAGQDMRVLMFATEVDACLERLTNVLADQNSQVLREEFELTSQEFSCLGEMLELPAFSQLCAEISTALANKDHNLQEVTTAALEAWRRSQALVLVSQFQALPEHFEIAPSRLDADPDSLNTFNLRENTQEVVDSDFLHEDETISLEQSSLDLAEFQDLNTEHSPVVNDPSTSEQSLDATIRIPLRQLEALSDRFGELQQIPIKRATSLVI